MSLTMAPHLFQFTNFRVPPKIELGPDGHTRIADEPEDFEGVASGLPPSQQMDWRGGPQHHQRLIRPSGLAVDPEELSRPSPVGLYGSSTRHRPNLRLDDHHFTYPTQQHSHSHPVPYSTTAEYEDSLQSHGFAAAGSRHGSSGNSSPTSIETGSHEQMGLSPVEGSSGFYHSHGQHTGTHGGLDFLDSVPSSGYHHSGGGYHLPPPPPGQSNLSHTRSYPTATTTSLDAATRGMDINTIPSSSNSSSSPPTSYLSSHTQSPPSYSSPISPLPSAAGGGGGVGGGGQGWLDNNSLRSLTTPSPQQQQHQPGYVDRSQGLVSPLSMNYPPYMQHQTNSATHMSQGHTTGLWPTNMHHHQQEQQLSHASLSAEDGWPSPVPSPTTTTMNTHQQQHHHHHHHQHQQHQQAQMARMRSASLGSLGSPISPFHSTSTIASSSLPSSFSPTPTNNSTGSSSSGANANSTNLAAPLSSLTSPLVAYSGNSRMSRRAQVAPYHHHHQHQHHPAVVGSPPRTQSRSPARAVRGMIEVTRNGQGQQGHQQQQQQQRQSGSATTAGGAAVAAAARDHNSANASGVAGYENANATAVQAARTSPSSINNDHDHDNGGGRASAALAHELSGSEMEMTKEEPSDAHTVALDWSSFGDSAVNSEQQQQQQTRDETGVYE